MTVEELLELAVKAAGTESPAAFARFYGLEGSYAPKRVKEWLTGLHKPRAEEVMLILTRLDLLRVPAERQAAKKEGLIATTLENLISSVDALRQELDETQRDVAALKSASKAPANARTLEATSRTRRRRQTPRS